MDVSDDERAERTEALEALLKYQFRNIDLLTQALTHTSYAHENLQDEPFDNERLEFLGDAVLNLVMSDLVMKQFPDQSEGELTRIRASTVNEKSLARVSRQIGLGRFIFLGKGESQTGGREKPSILADCYEAVLGAVYLDGGYREAFRLLESHFSGVLTRMRRKIPRQDFKSILQEETQNRYQRIPRYSLVKASGPDHEKEFCVSVSVKGTIMGHGVARTKKEAEQRAAEEALGKLRTETE